MESRRVRLEHVELAATTNAGLWLDKYMRGQLRSGESPGRDKEVFTHRLVRETAAIAVPESYRAFFAQWSVALLEIGAVARPATVQGRMVVGLGEESVLETSVTLHHTYGIPYIPGSALKGLAASYARNRLDPQTWGKDKDAYRYLFGDTQDAGYVTFFDALYDPATGGAGPLHNDVMTVHHPDYYQGKDSAPADWDSPTPISFLSATGTYLVALAGPPLWVDAAFRILEKALAQDGVGAKTSSGYGRMVLAGGERGKAPTASASGANVPEAALPTRLHPLVEQVQMLTGGQIAGQIEQFGVRWQKMPADDPGKRVLAEAILAKVREARREAKSAERPWYKEIVTYLEQGT